MQRKTMTVLCQGIAACALWVCGLQILQSAPAIAYQDTQAPEKTSKAKKSKKTSTDATSKQAPAVAADKTAKARKSKKSAADAASSQPTAPAAAVEKTPAPRKPKKSATDSTASGSANRAQTSVDEQTTPVRTASGAEIKSAEAGGKVWVNTDSGVYHKSGKWYGATKQGKFMTEQDAIKAGYRAAKSEK